MRSVIQHTVPATGAWPPFLRGVQLYHSSAPFISRPQMCPRCATAGFRHWLRAQAGPGGEKEGRWLGCPVQASEAQFTSHLATHCFPPRSCQSSGWSLHISGGSCSHFLLPPFPPLECPPLLVSFPKQLWKLLCFTSLLDGLGFLALPPPSLQVSHPLWGTGGHSVEEALSGTRALSAAHDLYLPPSCHSQMLGAPGDSFQVQKEVALLR